MFGRMSGSGSKSLFQLEWLLNSEIIASAIAFEQGLWLNTWVCHVPTTAADNLCESSPGSPWLPRAVLIPNSNWGLAAKSP